MIKKKPVLSSTGKHPIWFRCTLGYKVIDQYANVAFMTADNERCFIPGFLHCINPSNNALPRCFLIAGGSIDLARKKKILHLFRLQGWEKLCRRCKVVFNGISRSQKHSILQSWYAMYHIKLNL